MCRRFTLTAENVEWVAEQLGVPPEQLAEDFAPRYNIAPLQEHWIVRGWREEREAIRASWGLVNSWKTHNKQASWQVNARSETVAERPAYREAYQSRRCIVPADGFYEGARPGRRQPPYYVRSADGGLLHFAGLYEQWHPAGKPPETTFTIITTEPNAAVRPIHPRMPAILLPEVVDDWLFAPEAEADRLRALLVPAPDDLLTAVQVSRLVTSEENDGPELIQPVA
jgi:putative SOS response-associated peptidase YedK